MYDRLMKVSRGFKLVYIGLVIAVVAVLAGVVGVAVVAGGAAAANANNPNAAQQGAAGGMLAVVLGVVALALIGSIVGLVGRFFCLAVPDAAGAAKPMIMTSVGLEIANILVSIVSAADDAAELGLPQVAKAALQGASVIMSLTSAILFLLFARSVADFIRRRDLGRQAMSVLKLWAATVVCYLIGLGVMLAGLMAAGVAPGQAPPPGGGAGGAPPPGAAAAAGGACVGVIFMLAALVVGLIALVKYARLLTGMSQATAKYAERVGAGGGADDDYADEDGYDDEDDRPRGRSRRDDDYDDEEEDDRPRGRGRRDEDDDYDDDDDDRPRRRR
jgi:hypothetical protein